MFSKQRQRATPMGIYPRPSAGRRQRRQDGCRDNPVGKPDRGHFPHHRLQEGGLPVGSEKAKQDDDL